MSNAPTEEYTPSTNIPNQDLLQGNIAPNNDYVSRGGQAKEPVRVVRDDAGINQTGDISKPNSSERLQQDDSEAISNSNIIGSRTRKATKGGGTYTEPRDNEGIPESTGRSSTR